MDSSQLSCVALDVDHTLLRSIRTSSATNPYPNFQSLHIEDYFHFSHRTRSVRSNSHSATTRSSRVRTRSRSSSSDCHYHIYTRPGLRYLFKFLRYLQSETDGNLKIVVASMAKRDYVESIVRGLTRLFTEKKCPTFDRILARGSWDENQCPNSAPTYPASVLLKRYGRGIGTKMNLRYKSISRIAQSLHFDDDETKSNNIFVVDDNLGFFQKEDRASGQIYEIPAWNGPKPTKNCHRGNGATSNDITVPPLRKDDELRSLGAILQSIMTDFKSIQKYLLNRVHSVFRHEYGPKWKQQMQTRKYLLNVLMNDLGMDIDEQTATSSLWIFDNILRCCKQNGSEEQGTDIPIAEYLEMLFGCIIVYQMYIYNVYPSTHFYQVSFTQNEFWKRVKDVFFEYYVRLLFHIKQLPATFTKESADSTSNPSSTSTSTSTATKPTAYHTITRHRRSERLSSKRPSNASQFVSKFMKSTTTTSSPPSRSGSAKSTVHNIYHDLFAGRKAKDGPSDTASRSQMASPIQVAQSEATSLPLKADIEAQEEVIINTKHDIYGHIQTISLSSSSSNEELESVSTEQCDDDSIILTQQQYEAIEGNLKVLLRTISRSTFCRNKIPSALMDHGLLSATTSRYQRVLRKVYRDRHKLGV